MRRRIKKLLDSLVKYFVVLLACFIFFSPILWLILTSFKMEGEIYTYPPTILPRKPIIANYAEIFKQEGYLAYARNSIIVSFAGTALTVLVATLAAFGISRYVFFGNHAIFLFILITRMIPPLSFVVPLYTMVRIFKLMDTKILLIILNTTVALPSAVWILSIFFNQIPQDLEDAARVDGCSHLGVLWRIIVPLSVPSIATVTIFTFVGIWNEFLFALTFTQSTAARTLPVSLAVLLQPEHQTSWGQVAAFCTIVILPMLLIATFLQRYIVAGLLSGAVKG
ncbi:MAG: carbohydrate ABC transporter permease [bacterium]